MRIPPRRLPPLDFNGRIPEASQPQSPPRKRREAPALPPGSAWRAPPKTKPPEAKPGLAADLSSRRAVVHANGGAQGGPSTNTLLVRRKGGRTVIQASSGDDKLAIDQKRNGDVVVTDGHGARVVIKKDKARHGIVIQGGAGNDTIKATDRVTHKLVLEGGTGDDILRGGSGADEIDGGAGKDRIDGAAGDDYIEGGSGADIIHGGEGCDVVYGLGGNDKLDGGAGRDYVDGGNGNDDVAGGDGDDMLMGGRGRDRLLGGRGKDVMAGGSGRDSYVGGEGADTYYYQRRDRLNLVAADGDRAQRVKIDSRSGSSVKIEGTKTFKARVLSDFEAWRSLPKTGALLKELDARARSHGNRVTIREQRLRVLSSEVQGESGAMRQKDHTPSGGGHATITYSRTHRDLDEGAPSDFIPPSVELFHEAVHGHDIVHGNLPYQKPSANIGMTDGQENKERKAVGLDFDHDGNEATPREKAGRFSENQMRKLLGLPLRKKYKAPPGVE